MGGSELAERRLPSSRYFEERLAREIVAEQTGPAGAQRWNHTPEAHSAIRRSRYDALCLRIHARVLHQYAPPTPACAEISQNTSGERGGSGRVQEDQWISSEIASFGRRALRRGLAKKFD